MTVPIDIEAVASAPTPAPAATEASAGPAAAASEVRTRFGSIKRCYEAALKRRPDLSGRFVLHWTIMLDGHVQNVMVQSDTLVDPEVATCTAQMVARWVFPLPKGGTVDVDFPFVFQSSP